MCVKDHTDTAWMSAFSGSAESLFGMKADELFKMRGGDGGEQAYQRVLEVRNSGQAGCSFGARLGATWRLPKMRAATLLQTLNTQHMRKNMSLGVGVVSPQSFRAHVFGRPNSGHFANIPRLLERSIRTLDIEAKIDTAPRAPKTVPEDNPASGSAESRFVCTGMDFLA